MNRLTRALAAALAILGAAATAPVALRADTAALSVPEITAANLSKRAVTIPSGLDGQVNLLLVAFVREHQEDVDTWLGPVAEIAARRPLFDYYELPAVGPMVAPMRWFLDNAMRSGIPSRDQRRRTITIYADKDQLMDGLGNPPEDRIYAYLVDRAGAVLWQADGIASADKLAGLEAAIDATGLAPARP